jgi:hypothetical protein
VEGTISETNGTVSFEVQPPVLSLGFKPVEIKTIGFGTAEPKHISEYKSGFVQ